MSKIGIFLKSLCLIFTLLLSVEPLFGEQVSLNKDQGAFLYKNKLLISHVPPKDFEQSIELGNDTVAHKYKGFIVKHSESIFSQVNKTTIQITEASHSNSVTKSSDIFSVIKKNSSRAALGRVFTKTFGGFEVTGVKEGVLKELKAKGVILSYEPNFEVTKFLTQSIPQVKASSAWEKGFTGHGIRIGIIDTGVDYTHPDFGNCSTPQFLTGQCLKVMDGYDFVDMDNDPMDCHGHGTLVASIAGGRGVLSGVAPDSTIVPIRVLGCQGSGDSSAVLAGIEYSLDPDDDLDPSDHLDVINLSLGGYADPDSALSLGVDIATQFGVVAVVAAGNSGPTIESIASPANARDAIAVGSVDRHSNLSNFSSLGPVKWRNQGVDYSLLKPDIVAPGNPICAAKSAFGIFSSLPDCIDSHHTELSGTSLAAPHVAGAAALLLERNPSLAPAEVKGILKNSARPLPGSYLLSEQGRGLLNIESAILTDSVSVVSLKPIEQSGSNVRLKINSQVSSYKIHIAQSHNYNSRNHWKLLSSGTSFPAEGLTLSNFQFFEGANVVRITGLDVYGRKFEDFGVAEVSIFSLEGPYDREIFNPKLQLKIGISKPSQLMVNSFSIEHSIDGLNWSNAGVTLLPPSTGHLKAVLAGNTVTSNAVNIFFRVGVNHNIGSHQFKFSLLPDVTLRAGFPRSVLVSTLDGFAVSPGLLYPNVGQLDSSPEKEIVLYSGGEVEDKILIYSHNGELLNAISITDRLGDMISMSPLLFDVDNDGIDEIGIINGKIEFDPNTFETSYISNVLFFNLDGSIANGYPVRLPSFGHPTLGPYSLMASDFIGDKNQEIIATSANGTEIHILTARGDIINSFIVSNGAFLDCGSYGVLRTWAPFAQPIIGDLDGDCQKEMISYTTSSICDPNSVLPPYAEIVVNRSDGQVVMRIPEPSTNTHRNRFSIFNPLLLDFENDGRKELVIGTTVDGIHAFTSTGSLLPDWSVNGDSTTISDPIPFGRDNFGSARIGGLSLQLTNTGPEQKLQLFNKDGVLSGFNITFPLGIGAGMVAGSLSQDWNSATVLLNSQSPSHLLLGYDESLSPKNGYPKIGSSLNSYPVIEDLDGDGYAEVVSIFESFELYSSKKPRYYLLVRNGKDKLTKSAQFWPKYRHDKWLSGISTLVNPPITECR